MLRTLFACGLVFFSTASSADFASDFQDKVKTIAGKFQEIDKRVADLLAKPGQVSFARYAEIRNEVIRFLGDSRKEISQSRQLAEQNTSNRIQTEQELKVLLSDLEVDMTDEDSKPIPFSALAPRVDEAISQRRQQLEAQTKEAADLTRERTATQAKLRNDELTPEQKAPLAEQVRQLGQRITDARNTVRSLKTQTDQLRRAKELLARAVDFSVFSQKFSPEIERLESIEARATQRIQQIDEAIFNSLLVESNDKRYTLYSTLVFGIAVVIVIGSFFFVAYKSEAIRASIFANDSGLQFVTLFSLVIAIILFGVLKILEGRELAALLGGLSGYILGRGGISRLSPSAGSPPAPTQGAIGTTASSTGSATL